MACIKIPYAMEQGILKAVSRKFLYGVGNSSLGQYFDQPRARWAERRVRSTDRRRITRHRRPAWPALPFLSRGAGSGHMNKSPIILHDVAQIARVPDANHKAFHRLVGHAIRKRA
jgi:hypothetical protein